jgi:hypothetical protein
MANAGAFKKGEKRPNQGQRGPGKVTKDLKDMILKALDESGGVGYLKTVAKEKPVAFVGLLGRVLPMQVNANVDGSITVEIVRYGKSPASK